MVVSEYPYIDDNGNAREELIKHCSDEGFMIKQVETGLMYSEAVDVYPCRYTYEETDEPINEVTQ